MTPAHAHPIQWQQNIGYARAVCARIFRDGGRPADALAVFGLAADPAVTWATVVDRIATRLSAPTTRRRAA
jgi:hypothetical protein